MAASAGPRGRDRRPRRARLARARSRSGSRGRRDGSSPSSRCRRSARTSTSGRGARPTGSGPGSSSSSASRILLRTVVVALLTGGILEALEDGRVSSVRAPARAPGAPHGARRPCPVVQRSSSCGNLILPVLGPGIGFLGFVAALVAGLFLLGFAPTAAIREGRPSSTRSGRSARAALLPNPKHLVLCSLYFFLALPVLVGFAPGGSSITANPSLVTWVFAFAVNVIHVGFLAAFAYRWVGVEAVVPEEPVRRTRRQARSAAPPRTSRAPSARARGRRCGVGPSAARIVAGRLPFAGAATRRAHTRGDRTRGPGTHRVVIGGSARRRKPEGGSTCLSSPGGSSSRQASTSGTRRAAGTRRWVGSSTGSAPGSTSSTSRRPSRASRRRYTFAADLGRRGGIVLFVGTKKQAQEVIVEHATRVGMPYVNTRWLGGMLTNFQTISRRLIRLRELREMERRARSTTSRRRRRSACATSGRSSSATSAGCRRSTGSPTPSS